MKLYEVVAYDTETSSFMYRTSEDKESALKAGVDVFEMFYGIYEDKMEFHEMLENKYMSFETFRSKLLSSCGQVKIHTKFNTFVVFELVEMNIEGGETYDN